MPLNQEKEPSKENNSNINPDKAINIEKTNNIEDDIELSPRDIEARAEKARAEAIHTALSAEKKSKKSEKHDEYRHGSISKKQLNDSYKKTIGQIQSELPKNEVIFSKFIHNRVIEKTSDILSSTLARPDTMLSGAIFAFILTLATYITAKSIGYVLSGFETIIAFLLGWGLGLIYDYLRVLITGKKF